MDNTTTDRARQLMHWKQMICYLIENLQKNRCVELPQSTNKCRMLFAVEDGTVVIVINLLQRAPIKLMRFLFLIEDITESDGFDYNSRLPQSTEKGQPDGFQQNCTSAGIKCCLLSKRGAI